MARQVFLISGGATYKPEEEYLDYLRNYIITFGKHGLRQKDWLENLPERLGENFQVIRPAMPNRTCAKYSEWEIWFERFFPFLDEEIILVGYSLGGAFLLKYLAGHEFPSRIRALILIGTPHEDNPPFYTLNDFALPLNLHKVSLQAKQILIYHSKDDRSVPYKHAESLKVYLPSADIRAFDDRGHFLQNELPELTREIENIG